MGSLAQPPPLPMTLPQPNESQLLQELLLPLLEDFEYWFSKSRSFLESERVDCLTPDEQRDLLSRLERSQQELHSAKIMFQATEGQVGLEMSTLMPWHQLVSECWRVSQMWRSQQQTPES